MRLPVLLFTALSLAVSAAEVTLDTTFGGTGVVRPAFENLPSPDAAGTGRSVAVQADGRIVVAGYSRALMVQKFVVTRLLANGDLDTSFAMQGSLVVPLERDASASCVTLLPDGGILAAGKASNGVFDDMIVVKLDASGALDPAFGQDGKVILDFHGDDDAAAALAVDAQGRVLVAGSAVNSGVWSFAVARLSAAGVPDAGFGTDGRVSFHLGSDSRARDVVVQGSGRIILGGSSGPLRHHFSLAAFDDTGALDTTFGPDEQGYAVTVVGINNPDSSINSLALLSDGKILAVGYATVTSGRRKNLGLARYTADGLLDSGFGSSGTSYLSLGSGTEASEGAGVSLLGNGKFAVSGTVTGATSRFVISRHQPGGALDSAFGSSGKTITAFSGADASACGLAPRGTGWVVAGTVLADFESSNIGLAAYGDGGVLDSGFAGSGLKQLNLRLSPAFPLGRDVRVQPDGKVLLAGAVQTASGYAIALARHLADGGPDTGFGDQGRVLLTLGGDDDFANALLVQPDGKILVGGTSQQAGSGRAALIRLESDGTVDTSFATNGFYLAASTAGESAITSLALQADGKIVAAGYAPSNATNTVLWFSVWRFTGAGSLDTSFGTGTTGRLLTNFVSGRDAYAEAVAVLPDDKILAAGTAFATASAASAEFAVIRCTSAGALDGTFASGGKARIAFSDHATRCQSMVIDSDGGIILGGDAEDASLVLKFALARLGSDGAQDAAFGSGGQVVWSFPGAWYHYGRSLALDVSGGVLLAGQVIGGQTLPSLARFTAQGAVDTSFGTGGLALFSSLPGGVANAMALQPDGKILLAGNDGAAFFLARAQAAQSNTPPVAQNDTLAVLPGATVLLDVLANDSDADDDPLLITGFTQPAAGGVVSQVEDALVFTADAAFTGAVFNYTISDGAGGTAGATVTLTPVTTYAQWRIARFGAQADDPLVAGPDADPDEDGLKNTLEYALGLHPLETDAGVLLSRTVVAGRLVIEWRAWAAATDVVVAAEFASALAGWSALGVLVEEIGDDGIYQTWRATAPLPDPPGRQFGRLSVSF